MVRVPSNQGALLPNENTMLLQSSFGFSPGTEAKNY